jgi:hypothetical protein
MPPTGAVMVPITVLTDAVYGVGATRSPFMAARAAKQALRDYDSGVIAVASCDPRLSKPGMRPPI